MNKGRTILIAALAALSLTTMAQAGPETFKGKPMPSFSMVDTSGKKVTNASLKGKVVLIDFWATWCPPCREFTPVLQKLHKKYGSKGLVVLGADTFERTPEAQTKGAAAFAKQNGLTYRMTLKNDKFAESLKIDGIPTMFLIDKKGVVHTVNVGFDPSEVPKLDATIAQLLKG